MFKQTFQTPKVLKAGTRPATRVWGRGLSTWFWKWRGQEGTVVPFHLPFPFCHRMARPLPFLWTSCSNRSQPYPPPLSCPAWGGFWSTDLQHNGTSPHVLVQLHSHQMLLEREQEKEEDRRDVGSGSCSQKCEGASRARLSVSEACVCYWQMNFDLTSSCLCVFISKQE